MSKVLVIGASPLPFENERRISGPGIRTWQFVKPLLEDNHKVCLIALKDSGAYFKEKKEPFSRGKDFLYYPFDEERFMNIPVAQGLRDKFNPDCLISISSLYPSLLAQKIKAACPIWFDRGDIMAEAQLKSFNDQDDNIPRDFYAVEKSILARGDKFSVVSFAQKCSVIGRLGVASRLSRGTLGYEFVHVIPCGIDRIPFRRKGAFLRGKLVAKDDFIALWSGGYNIWTDVDTLFNGITYAMKRNKKIKFVSTGGALGAQDDLTYRRFTALIQKSGYRDRFSMLGWVAAENLASIYAESDLGINVDKSCYEALLGSRHRLMDWMISGLPFLTTTPSELTRILCNNRLAFGFLQGDSRSMGLKIMELSKNKRLLKSYSSRIKEYARDNYSLSKTALPLREWVKEPKFAPDKVTGDTGGKSGLSIVINSFDENERLLLDAQINDLKSNILELEDQRSSLQAHAKNLEDQRSSLQAHAKNLEDERGSLQQYIKDLENGLQQYMKNVEGERSGLQAHIKNLEDQRSSLQAHAKNLEDQRSSLQKHTKNLEDDRAALQEHINNLTGLCRDYAGELKKIKEHTTEPPIK